MRNAKVGDRVKVYVSATAHRVGTVILVYDDRMIQVDWDDAFCGNTHESQLIRLKPKSKVSRDELAEWWDKDINGRKGEFFDRANTSITFIKLCDLVGAK